MPLRTKIQITLTWVGATAAMLLAYGSGTKSWMTFGLLLVAVVVSSGLKVQLLNREGSMSLNYPFILLGVMQLSPFQVILLAGLSVAAQYRTRIRGSVVAVQLAFNMANAMLATACASLAYLAMQRLHVSGAPSIAVASLAYFVWNTASVAMVLGAIRGENAWTVWLHEYPWYLPFYLFGALLAATVDWLSGRFGWSTALLLIPAVYVLYRTYVEQIARLKEKQQYLDETEALQLRTIEGLAMAIEAKDQNTHDHLFRVRHYVQAVGEALKLTKLELKALETASFLHDIGKLAVPEYIINKPGKLTPEEFEKMKIHPSVGADILERVRFPYPVVPIVRSHHEWWNGTGYPDGLRGTDIPIGARILTVVDCFDALTSDRPYRRGMSPLQALTMIRSLSGKQFDPTVVDAFATTYEESERLLAETEAAPGFTPLNTDVDVWRGLAPGAGYEAGSDENAPSRRQDASAQTEEALGPTEEELGTMLAAASQAAQALFELTQTNGGTLTAEDTFAVIASRLRRLVPFDSLAIYLKGSSSLERRFVESAGRLHFVSAEIALGEGISGWVAQRARPILNGNASVEPGCPLLSDGSPALRSALSIPLLDVQGQCFAVLTLYSAMMDNFTRSHLRLLLTMEAKLALALQNALQNGATRLDEEVDFLTGLPNARRLFLHLESLLNARADATEPLAIAVCDLNNFREVNERRGHQAGNRLLRTLSDRFRHSLRAGEMVARMGGDEFVFAFPLVQQEEAAALIAELRKATASAGVAAAVGLPLTASMGFACYPDDGSTAEDLLACASRRMYLEKQKHYSQRTAQSVETDAAHALAPGA